MAEINGPVASAVIVPELQPRSPPSKRRRSSSADSTSKRPKILEEKQAESAKIQKENSNAAESLPGAAQEDSRNGRTSERRKSSVQEERKRGQRLFGGLLSTLSQSTPVNQQKRRLEIEKRQLEKAKQQKAADEGRKAEKLAHLKEVRKVEYVKFSEQAMRTRHSNVLAMANFLSTKAEPKLFYKPWELLPTDEDRIKQQITDTEVLIQREVDEFNAQHPQSVQQSNGETNGTSQETVGENHTKSPSVPKDIDTTNPPPQAHASDRTSVERHDQEEHSGEIVVENDEDTVIF